MALQVNGALVVRRNRENVDLIAILNFESAKFLGDGIGIAGRRKYPA